MSIAVNNLCKVYGSQKAVNSISFKIDKGEIVGFLGPNGAGKSTTMKIITGYLKSDSGSVDVCGITVNEKSKDIKKKIGYLPEANPLYADMYVREYLNFIANLHHINNKKEKIEEILQTVGLNTEANKKIAQLSKGYKQRVGLAAALIHNPEVLILDEPTSGLDPNQIVEIREVIKKLGKDKTVLFSSHILQEILAICSRVIIINKGKVVADNTLSNLQQTNNALPFIEVRFKEKIDIKWLKNLSQVINVKNTQYSIFKIQCSNADAVKKQIFQLAIDKNLNIISLQSNTSATLEDIFRNLTTGNEPSTAD